MGGKAKQAQRTKNNSRPSNSGRSAELLGSAVPSFVGFATHSDFGIVPLAPGFTTAESLPDTFDSTISSQYQLVLRKMSKKDPVTKVKALQEFAELISESEVDVVKTILPLWPKFYYNLANDVEHRVREAAQNVQSAIVTKIGKAMAPYLKQLAPVWISSQFDNHAPVASLAASTFKASFSPAKKQDVFCFCQNEIIDYISKNLTYHTAATLNSTKSCTAEEAENKYQRMVICSLKSLSLLLEQTSDKHTPEAIDKLKALLQNAKFWSFSKHKIPAIRAAWFENIYSFLQHTPEVVAENKNQVIQITFQNMDDNDPLTTPHIWGCIILIQGSFGDWSAYTDFRKVVLPKLFTILKTGANSCAAAVFPNLLPFISKIEEGTIPNYPLRDFYAEFFNNIKKFITLDMKSSTSKADASAVISAFYECLRYVIQMASSSSTMDLADAKRFCTSLLNEFVIDIIKWNVVNETITTKYVFVHTSSLVSYWSQNADSCELYKYLLEQFWKLLMKLITENQELEEDISKYVERFVEYIQTLYHAAPFRHDNKVTFCENSSELETVPKSKGSLLPLQKDLKIVVIELMKLLIKRSSKENTTKCMAQLKILSDMFGDAEFFSKVTDGGDLQSAVDSFYHFLVNCSPPSEEVIDIVFEILVLFDKNEKMQNINKLLQIEVKIIQQWVLQRLLSYPLCIEPQIRDILSQKNVSNLILDITHDVIKENSKEKFNLLHKCFFQIDSGEILINSETVEGITRIMSEPLVNEDMKDILDMCGSFIAQIMPVICSNNSTKTLQREVFLKLFKFSVNMVESDHLSEDTLWEITTCWQDALSSNDIELDTVLLEDCVQIVEKRMTNSENLSVSEISNISDMCAKLIFCSTENIKLEEERYTKIDILIEKLLEHPKYLQNFEQLKDVCAFYEALMGKITLNEIKGEFVQKLPSLNLRNFFRRQLLNFSTIFKLTCNVKNEKHLKLLESAGDDHEFTEDYFDPSENLLQVWSEKIYDHFLMSLNSAAIGESLNLNSFVVTEEVEELILNLTEKITLALKHSADTFITIIKMKLFSNASGDDISWARAIPFLLFTSPFDKNENGAILLYEESTNFALDKKSNLGFINITNILLPKLESKALPINYDILADHVDLTYKEVGLRLFVLNHFSGDFNDFSDRKLISFCLDLITEVSARQLTLNNFLLYNQEIQKAEFNKVICVVEFIHFLTKVLETFPTELSTKHWDIVRIGLSSWILSVSQSFEHFKDPKVALFISSVYKLFAALSKFISEEKIKSSTELLSNVIDEWENLFARAVNLVILKCFYSLVSYEDENSCTITRGALLEAICPTIEYLNFAIIYNACESDFKISVDDLIDFSLKNLSNDFDCVSVACLVIIYNLSEFLIANDMKTLEKRSEIIDRGNNEVAAQDIWHVFGKFAPYLEKYGQQIIKYLADFSYKLTELSNLQTIKRSEAIPYFFLWDCIIQVCSKAPAELRSYYAKWLTEKKFENIFLNFLIRAMPVEILKNHDSKVMNNDIFKGVTPKQFKESTTTVERYACHFYSQILRHLPAVVRKWWTATNARQKTFVDKLTTNFVSNLICQEELRGIVNKREKHNNMQVTVHNSTREVVAVYTIDEARMELIITLAPNHPLGAVKVESGRQLGGRAHSRNLGMQLTIFLTHQNGSIFDGLSLWKKNLDKKFEGVEECYVCYTVIHQDTYELPRLSCKTCKKKFHGPCLYKWFTTSRKSTCPICRNIF